MRIESFKAVFYEGATFPYEESPCFKSLNEVLQWLWDHPYGDDYFTCDGNKIKSFDGLKEAYSKNNLDMIPDDDRKSFMIEHHEIDIDVSKFTEPFVKLEKFWKDKWFEQREITGKLGYTFCIPASYKKNK